MAIQALVTASGLGAFVAWIVAVVSAIAMARHRAPGVTLFYLATHGIAFFDGRSFTEAAAPHRARFVRAFGAFFAFVVAGVVLGIVASSP